MPRELSLTTLNVGRLLQARTWNYLERLASGEIKQPDVMCVQDVPFRDLNLFEWAPHIAFAPMTNHLINGERAVVGIAIVSRYFMTDIVHRTTWGDGGLKYLQGINEQNQRYLGAESDTLVEATEDRVAICATVMKDRQLFDIATTHGMWVRDGVPNDVQRRSTRALIGFLSEEVLTRDGLVLAGDMNFGRGGEIYQMFADHEFRDCIPLTIDNTLDLEHPTVKKGIRVVTDHFMTRAGVFSDKHGYHVSDVHLRSGVSDHCALSATVSKT